MTKSTTRFVQIPSELSSVAVLGAADAGLREVEHAFPEADITVRAKMFKLLLVQLEQMKMQLKLSMRLGA